MFYIYAGNQQIYKPLDDLLVLFNPKLTLELGKAGALEFDIPPINPYYSSLMQLSTEVSVDMDNEEIFHGRVLSNERMFNNVRHVYCEGDLSYLIDSVQKGVQYSGTTHDLFRRIIANHNARMDASKRFMVGTINIENRNIVLVGQTASENLNAGAIDYKQIAIDSIVDNWNNSFDYIQTCLIDYCGGYLRTRRENGTIFIDLLQDFSNRAIQPIELGSNLLDLTEEVNAQDVFTVLVPLGDDNLTIATVNGGSDELVDTVAAARFGRIVRTHVFNNVSSPLTLLENAQRYLATNVNVPRTITVRAVDLHLLNKLISPIHIGDKVSIISAAHDVDDALTCTRIEYDLEKPENNNYTFGNPKQTLTQRYREDVRLSNDTYGNSAAASTANTANSASAKGASAAAAAAKKADTEKDKSLQQFYDAWINCDPELGQISLGALHRDYINGKEVLLSQCGIDMDGDTGNINIHSLHNVVDDHGHLIAENTAHINIVETDTAVAIESVTERVEHLAGEEAEHYTAITQRADTLGSSIDLLARDVHEFEDGTTTALANINMTTNDHEARITSNTNFASNLDDRVTTGFTSIKQITDDHESRIQSNASFTAEVDGKLTTAVNSITQITNDHESRIQSNASFISTVDGRLTKAVNDITQITNDHESRIQSNTRFYSDLSETVSNNYTSFTQKSTALESSIQSHTAAISDLNSYYTAIDQRSSDNSAAIKIVAGDAKNNKDNIAAITLRVTEAESQITLKANKVYVDGLLEAEQARLDKLMTGTSVATKLVANTITADAINLKIGTSSSPVVSKVHSHNITAKENDDGTITISIGSANTDTIPQKASFDIAKTKKYTAGVAAVNVKTVESMSYSSTGNFTAELVDSYVRYSNEQIVGRIRVTLDNNNQKNIVVKMAGKRAYDAGVASVTATAPTLDTSWATSSTGYIYRSAQNRYEVRVKSNASNGNSLSGSVYVSGEAAYNAGNTAGVASVTATAPTLDTSWATSSTGYIYRSAQNRYEVRVKSNASNGNSLSGSVYVSATDAYNTGYNAGNTDGVASVDALASSNNIGYETDDGGATDYNHIWIKLENNKMIGNIALPSGGSGNVSIELGSYGSQAANANYPYYYQNSAGTLGTIKAVAKRGSSQIASADLDITGLIQYVYNSGGGGSGNSYYYWSDEKSGPYGSRQRDCYFVIDGSIAHTAKVIWSEGNPTFQ